LLSTLRSHSPKQSWRLLAGDVPVVGFCFSFPMEQLALNNARLMHWTKGFDVEGVVGKDVVKLLSGEAGVGLGRRGRTGGEAQNVTGGCGVAAECASDN